MASWISNIANRLAGWPVIGPLVRISVALVQLPDLRDRFESVELQQLPDQGRRIIELFDLTNDIRDEHARDVSYIHGIIGEPSSSHWYPESDINARIELLLEMIESSAGRIEFFRR